MTYTKRRHTAALAINNVALAVVRAEIAALNVESELIRLAGQPMPSDIGDRFNAAVDREHALEVERREIERRWDTRDWTSEDHQMAELVARNIEDCPLTLAPL